MVLWVFRPALGYGLAPLLAVRCVVLAVTLAFLLAMGLGPRAGIGSGSLRIDLAPSSHRLAVANASTVLALSSMAVDRPLPFRKGIKWLGFAARNAGLFHAHIFAMSAVTTDRELSHQRG